MKILLYSKQKGKAYITKITLEPYSDTVVPASIVFNNWVDKKAKKKMPRPFKQTLYNPIKMQICTWSTCVFFIKSRSTKTKDIEV